MDTERRSWRLFCAVDLPANARARVLRHSEELRTRFPEVSASWSRESNIHLTLKFIGEVPATRAADLSRAAAHAVESLAAFEFELESAGAFPARGSPKVLWLGIVDKSGALAKLHSQLENECAREGFVREAREFHPHLTVARIRKPHGAFRLAKAHKQIGFESIKVDVSELLVIRSELSSQGSRYTVISRHALK